MTRMVHHAVVHSLEVNEVNLIVVVVEKVDEERIR